MCHRHVWVMGFSIALALVSCAQRERVATPMANTVTTPAYTFSPPVGWPLYVEGDSAFMISAGDARQIERDRSLAAEDALWIEIHTSTLSPEFPIDPAAATPLLTEACGAAGDRPMVALEDGPWQSLEPARFGDFAGYQADRISGATVCRSILLEIGPGHALRVALSIPPGHPGLDVALATLASLHRATARP